MQKQIGIAVVFICVLGGFLMAGGRLLALWQPAELIIILGAAAGSLIIGNSKEVLHEMWAQIKQVIRPQKTQGELYRELLADSITGAAPKPNAAAPG